MRRKWLLASAVGIGLAALFISWQRQGIGAGQGVDNGAKPQGDGGPLPIRQVVLFNSGVGYFQREGEVQGDARVELTFPASDVNDLLKSLILQDLGGGKVSTVSYDSHDPTDKILRSFALDLNNNPSFGQILNQARGEKIEVTRQEKKEGLLNKIIGSIVGMEVQRKPVAKDQVADVDVLNLSTALGLQSLPLEQVVSVRFLNPVLEREFQRALQVLASSHDAQKKLVSLGFNGPGKRAVRVGYVVERPIWKTTYRLRIEPNGKIFLQGWAIVENTSDDDWNDIRMVLVSGKPISYQMNLYEPLYIPRPTVEPEHFASLRPPVYSGSMMEPGRGPAPAEKAAQAQQPMAPPGPGNAMMNFPPGWNPNWNPYAWQMQMGGGFQGGQAGGQTPQQGLFNPNNEQQRYQQNFRQNNDLQALVQNQGNRLTFEELQERRNKQEKEKGDAKRAGATIAGLNFKEGIASLASADEIGDYFRYVIDQKISLARQKSAMLPILDQTIEGSKVSIFNASVHSRYPLLGLRLKNSSGQPLTQGPITVYEESSYAGDTRILDIQPNEERLLSYALDQATEVKIETKSHPSPDMNFKIGEAQLTANYKLRQTTIYNVKNRSPHDRTLVIEHPITSGWKLIDPEKPLDKSRSVYRFQVSVPAGKLVKFDIVEEQARVDSFGLTHDGKAPIYAVGMGVQVKQITRAEPEKLTRLTIAKGLLFPTYKVRESKTYFVQNLSEEDRDFTVDHIVRPDWVRLDGADKAQRGPDVYRFVLKVAKGKAGSQEIVEERTYLDKVKTLKEMPEAKLREFLTSAVPTADVKAAITQSLAKQAKIAETKKGLDEQEKALKVLADDQGRLRSNLQIIPQSAEPYKKFLDKFVNQETEIEGYQRVIRQLQASLAQLEREYALWIVAVNAE